MKPNVLKITAAAAVLAIFGYGSMVTTRAQSKSAPSAAVTSINWIGYVVSGKEETIDRLARGAYPKTDRQFEIGLRSDGVVVWRRTGRDH